MGRLRETTFREIPPRPSLKEYVDGVWFSEASAPHTLHILPTTRSTFMTCSTPYGRGVVLVGALSAAQHVELEGGNVKVGAWLKAGSRYLFCESEPSELRDSVVVGRDMSQMVQDFEAKIEHTTTWQEKLECLQDFLELLIQNDHIVRHKVVDQFIDTVKATGGQTTVEELMQDLPMSYRQSLRLIKHYTGFTAKEFSQLHRFSITARNLDTPGQTISVLAARHGYTDHPHFSREFRAKVGVTPSAFGNHQAL